MTRSFSWEVLSECETFNFHSVPALMFQHPNDVNGCDTSTKGSVVNILFGPAPVPPSVPLFQYFIISHLPFQTFQPFLLSERQIWPLSLQVGEDEAASAGSGDSRLPGSGRPLWWWPGWVSQCGLYFTSVCHQTSGELKKVCLSLATRLTK